MFKPAALLTLGLMLFDFGAWAEEVLPDPTRPLEYSGSVKVPTSLKLNSILISQDRKVAVINGVQLVENQWYGDKRVVRIQSNAVILDHQGSTIVLSLHHQKVRQ